MHRLATIHNVTVDDGDRRTQHYMAKKRHDFLKYETGFYSIRSRPL